MPTTYDLGFSHSHEPKPEQPREPSRLPPGIYSTDSEGRIIAGPTDTVSKKTIRIRRLIGLLAK